MVGWQTELYHCYRNVGTLEHWDVCLRLIVRLMVRLSVHLRVRLHRVHKAHISAEI